LYYIKLIKTTYSPILYYYPKLPYIFIHYILSFYNCYIVARVIHYPLYNPPFSIFPYL
ncbi:hypothetical protein CCHL11_06676, partial [Colletotrichum chlorophyti]